MEINLFKPIENLPKINPKILNKLKKIGINQIKDLLYHFPHRYEDYGQITKIKDLKLNKISTIQGRILNIRNIRTLKKRVILTEALIEDDTSNIIAIWFNQPFLLKNIKKGYIVNLAGKIVLGKNGIYISNPNYEIIAKSPSLKFEIPENEKEKFSNLQMPDYEPIFKETIHTGRLVPIYPETKGLTSRWLRFLIRPLLKNLHQLVDILPQEVKKNQKLPNLIWALKNIHFPDNLNNAELAKKRMAFEELFLLQMLMLKTKQNIKKERADSINLDIDLIKNFLNLLPFKLTADQKKALWQIFQDLKRDFPMNRLLEGDVGSGKTIVALTAAFLTVKNGFQVAFMVPTEILANQHFKNFIEILKNFDVKIGLLTSGASRFFDGKEIKNIKKNQLIEKLKNGEIQIVIGTHSLIAECPENKTKQISAQIKFKNLAFVIIDEQHRFGVRQRAKLLNLANKTPHLLSMTATPIPRTLALTIYGDLDISIINELPKGRKKIITKIITPNKREAAYKLVEKEILNGRQVFVICPRIEPGKKQENKENKKLTQQKILWQEIKAVKEEFEKLKKIFSKFKIAMLHGKMKSAEKEKIMTDFSKNKINILVSTSVIEVGIDIKNASLMIIEGAERFGLAQLHQLRGRIGRGEHQSYCLLFTESNSYNTTQRLNALIKCGNGFELAQKDLEIRGPGDFWGTQQWGLPDLTMASLANLPLIEKAKEEAEKILKKDPELNSYPLLKEKLESYKKEIHFE